MNYDYICQNGVGIWFLVGDEKIFRQPNLICIDFLGKQIGLVDNFIYVNEYIKLINQPFVLELKYNECGFIEKYENGTTKIRINNASVVRLISKAIVPNVPNSADEMIMLDCVIKGEFDYES